MSGLLNGRIAFVSGVGPGLGRDIALELAEHGADVVVGARTLSTCESIANEVRSRGRRSLAVNLDVTSAESCSAAVAAAVAEFERIDVLVNNAAHFGTFTRFLDADPDEWRDTFEVNLWGTLRLTHGIARSMRNRGEGRIININSMAANLVQSGLGAYTGSKAAIAALTKTLARELGRDGIRVNGVHAGYIWGDRFEDHLHQLAAHRNIDFEEQSRASAAQSALGMIPTSKDIAGTVVFLASDLSLPITGQAIHVNAGHWMP